MSVLESTAKDIYSVANGIPQEQPQTVVFDPATISLIISIVGNLVRIIKACRDESYHKPQQVCYYLQEPSRRDQRIIKRTIRRQIGWRRWIYEGQDIYRGILETGKQMSSNQMTQLFEEIP